MSPASCRRAARGDKLLFEGAQGALLDVDHGTYPYVTSSNCVAGAASAGAGVGPGQLNFILGIAKAYATRVGSGPFPTELTDAIGERPAERGHEFGAVTGRPRRCGWYDAVAMKRSIELNGVSALCLTKLDVLDGVEELQVCVGYRIDGADRQEVAQLAVDAVADADLQRVHAVEHVELGHAQAGNAVDLDRALERGGVEPAAAARPPGGGAELLAALASCSPRRPTSSVGNGPVAHARGVGLGDAEHVVEVLRADARPRRGRAGHAVATR